MKCSNCKSDQVIKTGLKQYSGGMKQRYYCKSCFKYFIP